MCHWPCQCLSRWETARLCRHWRPARVLKECYEEIDMSTSQFDELQETLDKDGVEGALEALVTALRSEKKYHELFDALLLGKRYALGLPLVQKGTLGEVPDEKRRALEDEYVACCRTVGDLYLAEGDVAHAWVYLRTIDETAKVSEALERIDPALEREDLDQIIDVALHQGANPRKGYELLLKSYGTCNAVTTMDQIYGRTSPADRAACVGMLVRQLHGDLVESLRADIAHRGAEQGDQAAESPEALPSSVPELIAGRDWLFGEHSYHVDASHLSAAVRFSRDLEPGPDLDLAIEFTEYGRRLAPMFQYASDPPFDKFYDDHGLYLKALRGENVEEAVAHFQQKLEKAEDDAKPACAAVQVSLLDRLGRAREAIAVSLEHLSHVQDAGGAFPTVADLCQKAGDYRGLIDFSRQRGDLVSFLAGLVEARAEGRSK